MEIRVVFSGIEGSTGLVGDESITRVIVLAPTVLEITEVTGSAIAGETVTFHGTLLDEHGQSLLDQGVETGGVIHLTIDGIDVGAMYSTQSNYSTGELVDNL